MRRLAGRAESIPRNRRGRGMAPARQPPPEQVATSRQAAADRSHGTFQLLGRLVVRLPFEIAEDERSAVLPRQPVQLLIEHRSDPQDVRGFRVRRRLQILNSDFSAAPTERIGPRSPRDPVSHAEKPVGQVQSVTDRRCLAHQDQKSRLKGVFDIPRIAQNPAANAQYHGSMQIDQRLKGGFISARQIALQQLAIPESGKRPISVQPIELLKYTRDSRWPSYKLSYFDARSYLLTAPASRHQSAILEEMRFFFPIRLNETNGSTDTFNTRQFIATFPEAERQVAGCYRFESILPKAGQSNLVPAG